MPYHLTYYLFKIECSTRLFQIKNAWSAFAKYWCQVYFNLKMSSNAFSSVFISIFLTTRVERNSKKIDTDNKWTFK